MKSCLTSCKLNDDAGRLAQNISGNWLKGIWQRNPAMLGMVADRDVDPWPDLLLWSGEFSGKYITGAYYIYRLTGDEALRSDVLDFIYRFLTLVEPDCYFGVVPKELRFTGAGQDAPGLSGVVWDGWSCYHMIEGLLHWYEATDNDRLLCAATAGVDLLHQYFFDGKHSLLSMGSPEMNLSIYHCVAKICRITGKSKYQRFAKQIEQDILSETPRNWMAAPSKDLAFYQCDTPRWERLHTIMGAAQMYQVTHDPRYLKTLQYIIDSILQTDIHNSGAFSTDEWAKNARFVNGNIETCCVIAFNALCCDYLEICAPEERRKILDHLELSYYNAVLGYNSTTGAWCTYSTPMDGVRNASIKENGFQIRSGSPELNCCSVNAPRGVGELWRWMLQSDADCLYLNYFGACELRLDDGGTIRIEGDYPCSDIVLIHITPGIQYKRLFIRIPGWATHMTITDCDGTHKASEDYWETDMSQQTITIDLRFQPRYLPGEGEYRGKYSVYRGPLLFGMRVAPKRITQAIPAPHIAHAEVIRQDDGISLILPSGIRLKDFYHLGQDGREYKTWLDIYGI